MDINVTVTKPDLNARIPDPYGDGVTLGELVARKLTAEFQRTDGWDGIAERIKKIRDEEIRAQLAPIITDAIHKPVVKTNHYGEPTGETTTLREVIVKEAREALTRRTDTYGRNNETNLSKIVRAEVEQAFRAEIAEVVKQVRDQTIAQIGDTAREQITAAALDALKSR